MNISEMNMNGLFKYIHGKARIEIAIQNIERNITIRYMDSVVVSFLALCVLGVVMTMDVVESTNFYIAGWGVSVLGFCLAVYFAISAYQIRKKLNLLLEEMAQDKGEEEK